MVEHKHTSTNDVELITTNKPVEIVRSEEDGQEYIRGYAVVWHNPTNPGTTYKLPHGILERVDRNAFDEVLSSQENFPVVYAHEQSHYLGDTETETAYAVADDYGILVTVPVDAEDPIISNVKAKIRKKIIRGMSFKGNGVSTKHREPNGQVVSTITKVVNVDDFSFVHKPAYRATTADLIRHELTEFEAMEERRKKQAEIVAKINTYLTKPEG